MIAKHIIAYIYVVCLCLQNIECGRRSREDHVVSMSTSNSTSDWIVYIHETLHSIIQRSSSGTADQLSVLHSHTSLLWIWCHLPESSDVDMNNTQSWTPCGAMQYVTMQMQTPITWTIKVNFNFYIEIIFHVFKIDALGKDCLRSALVLFGSKASRRMCGHRQPWHELIDSHIVFIKVQQRDVINTMKLSFTYSLRNQFNLNIIMRMSRTHSIKLKDLPRQSLRYTVINKMTYSIKWQLRAPIGVIIRISTSSVVFNQLLIYTGYGTHHLIVDSVTWRRRMTKLINYYVAAVHLGARISSYEEMVYMLCTLQFWHINLKPTKLSITSERVQNFGGIYYKLFSIEPQNGSYPNISFRIRQADGWREGNCIYWGFLFKQYLHSSQLEPQTLGPYCTDSEPNHPLAGTDGLDYVVFGMTGVHLIIYVNGPLYTIDLDILVSYSSCEGIVSPVYLCSFVKQDKDQNHNVIFPSFTISCRARITSIRISFVHLSRCLLIQKFEKEADILVIVEVVSSIDLHAIIKLVNNFLLATTESSDTFFGLKYQQEGTQTVHQVIRNSSILAMQSVSAVSILTSILTRTVYYAYALHVVPHSTRSSCADMELVTKTMAIKDVDVQYAAELSTGCGFGYYKESGNYLFQFDIHSSTPHILFLQFESPACQTNPLTHDVLIACESIMNCHALELIEHNVHLFSFMITTTYRYNMNSGCSSFNLEYNLVTFNMLATMSFNVSSEVFTIQVSMFTTICT